MKFTVTSSCLFFIYSTETRRSQGFLFFTRQKVLARKIGRVSVGWRARERPIGIGRRICSGLTSLVLGILIGELEFYNVNRGFGINRGIITKLEFWKSYKSFIRPHLDYADIIYDQSNKLNLCYKIETCQYIADLAITGANRGLSKERLYQELGFEYLSSRRWLRKLCTFYRIVRNKHSGYLCKYILPGNCDYLTWNCNNIKQIFCRSEYFAKLWAI